MLAHCHTSTHLVHYEPFRCRPNIIDRLYTHIQPRATCNLLSDNLFPPYYTMCHDVCHYLTTHFHQQPIVSYHFTRIRMKIQSKHVVQTKICRFLSKVLVKSTSAEKLWKDLSTKRHRYTKYIPRSCIIVIFSIEMIKLVVNIICNVFL